MKKETLLKGIGEVDDRILARYEQIDARLAAKHATKRHALRILAIAACAVLILCAIVPGAMMVHPAGRAVLQGDSEALTLQLNKIEGFPAWQEKTAEKLEQTLPGGVWEHLQTMPVLDVLTKSQYPAFAYKGMRFGPYVAEPVAQAYFLEGSGKYFSVESVMDTTAKRYVDQAAAETFTYKEGERTFELRYAYSETQSLERQAAHVYQLHTKEGVYVATVDAVTGACIGWSTPVRAEVVPQGGVSEESMISKAYGILAQSVRDPEEYVLIERIYKEDGSYVCEYNRLFHSLYTPNENVEVMDMTPKSCDRAIVTFDCAGNPVAYELCYLGALRNADKEIPSNLFAFAMDYAYHALHQAGVSFGSSGLTDGVRVVILPEGRLALSYGARYEFHDGDKTTFGYLTYLTAEDAALADRAYPITQVKDAPRVNLTEIVYYAQFKKTAVSENRYDEDGKLVLSIMYVDGKEQYRWAYTYDEQGREIERTSTVTGGSVKSFYSEQGNLVKEEHYDYRGKKDSETLFAYDELGRLVREESDTYLTVREYGENNSFTVLTQSKTSDYVQKMEYVFDDRGNLISQRVYEGEIVTSEIRYEYNDENLQIGYAAYVNGERVSYNVTEYRDGKEVRTYCYRRDEDSFVSTPYYNQFGECIRRESVGVDGKLIQSYEYEYDYAK